LNRLDLNQARRKEKEEDQDKDDEYADARCCQI